MTWTVEVPLKVDDTQAGTPEVRALSLVCADAATLPFASVTLGGKGADGTFHAAVDIQPLELRDRPAEAGDVAQPPEPDPAHLARDFIDAIMTAAIDGDSPLAQRFGIKDKSPLAEALPQIAWGLLYPKSPITRT